MIRPALRTAAFAAVTALLGPRLITAIERRLGGRKALTARLHMAHRAARAEMFHQMKRGKPE